MARTRRSRLRRFTIVWTAQGTAEIEAASAPEAEQQLVESMPESWGVVDIADITELLPTPLRLVKRDE